MAITRSIIVSESIYLGRSGSKLISIPEIEIEAKVAADSIIQGSNYSYDPLNNILCWEEF